MPRKSDKSSGKTGGRAAKHRECLERRVQVERLLVQQLSVDEICDKLGLDRKTVASDIAYIERDWQGDGSQAKWALLEREAWRRWRESCANGTDDPRLLDALANIIQRRHPPKRTLDVRISKVTLTGRKAEKLLDAIASVGPDFTERDGDD